MCSPESTSPQVASAQPISTEARILQVATILFYEKGYHASTMREVAAGVGIKAGSLYNHYPSKQELLHQIAQGVMVELLERGQQVVALQDNPRSKLVALIRQHIIYHAEYRYRAKVADDQLHALDPERRREVIDVRDRYERLWRDLLAEGRDAHGWVVPDIAVVTFAITTMCTSVVVWYRETGRLTSVEIAEIYADFVLGALERDPAG